VPIVVHQEAWVEANKTHIFATIFLFAIAHVLLQAGHARFIAQSTLDIPPTEDEEFPQSLGLRDRG
jgi:hypothetical protein